MQAAQLAQQDLAQQRALAANAQNQARAQFFNAQQAGLDRAFKVGMAGAEWEADRQAANERFDLAGMQAEAAWDRAALTAEAADERSRLAAEEMARRSADHDRRMGEMWAARDREDWLAAGLKGGSLYYTPQQKQSMNNLRGAMHALATDSTHFTPEEQQAELRTLQEQYDKIRTSPFERTPDEAPPSVDEQIESKSVWKTDPDGVRRRYQVITRNGVEQVDVVAEEDKSDPMMEFAKSMIGKTKAGKDANGMPTQQPYTAQDIADEWRKQQEAVALIKGGGKQQQSGKAQFGGGMQLPQQQQAPPPSPPPQEAVAQADLAPNTIIADPQGQQFWVDPQSGQPMPVFPRYSAAAAQQGSLLLDDDGNVLLVAGPGQYQKVGKVEKEQPQDDFEAMYRSLPSGAEYVGPDGKRRKKR